jgi:hypothetical protein
MLREISGNHQQPAPAVQPRLRSQVDQFAVEAAEILVAGSQKRYCIMARWLKEALLSDQAPDLEHMTQMLQSETACAHAAPACAWLAVPGFAGLMHSPRAPVWHGEPRLAPVSCAPSHRSGSWGAR